MQATVASKREPAPYGATRNSAHHQKLAPAGATSEVRRVADANTAIFATTNQARQPNARNTEEEPKKEGLFEGLSMAQLGAGALAAVTSMLLASRIGIAGSVIGVAIASVVSAVAAHVYRRVFEASAEKIRTIGSSDDTMRMPVVSDSQTAAIANASTVAMRAATQHNTSIDDASRHGSASVQAPAGATEAMNADQVKAALTRHSRNHITASDVRAAGHTARRGSMSAAGNAPSQHKTRVMAIAVSVVAALVAVAISAFVIDIVTEGQGVGAKPAAITWTVPDETSEDSGAADSSAGESPDADGKDSASSAAATDTSPGASDGTDAGAPESTGVDSGSNANATAGEASSSGTDASGTSADSASGQSASTGTGSTSGESASSNVTATDSSTSEDQLSAQGQSAANDSSSSSASTDAKTQQSTA